ncbi:4-hydroxythreonine-4-phosphate dehydrogenase PdxA [Legionella worsleiensis]|uniref:4-hydroxythreonine-4-phosphate dehydrogenase n=1 Tax=Legionella worsleiensis TaxID=45076 RepID=A0A0W1AJL0_9GAMM|nr:4-hydroxythreonine-4-phosphate dehydrogenase PdxA [Legionella worsleiensis]KTD81476.1 4-hydroxythreonine-4-phosphate dehydrogenase [Legionella worsleiensis]STY32035.1 4-hydroxythreonine-4-phosphate dehydrogenase [Legionella worsleiensis]
MKPLLVSSGEPAGIGPDLCLELAASSIPIVVLGDLHVLKSRAMQLSKPINFYEYNAAKGVKTEQGSLTVLPVSCPGQVIPGELNPENAAYVIELLTLGATLCSQGDFSALVTAPVHKANINSAGIAFSGHTEFFAQFFNVDQVVMMLACQTMKVALMTTHLPLRLVPDAISPSLIIKVITMLHHSLAHDFGIINPIIKVAGLNPHAGESGYLGREEIEIISPSLLVLREQGIDVRGPLSADTMFVEKNQDACDAYVAMYHDQGLPVLKYAGFNQSVNVTLGLPIIRTSVDHGTALELAGKNAADHGSLLAAVTMAAEMAKSRNRV